MSPGNGNKQLFSDIIKVYENKIIKNSVKNNIKSNFTKNSELYKEYKSLREIVIQKRKANTKWLKSNSNKKLIITYNESKKKIDAKIKEIKNKLETIPKEIQNSNLSIEMMKNIISNIEYESNISIINHRINSLDERLKKNKSIK